MKPPSPPPSSTFTSTAQPATTPWRAQPKALNSIGSFLATKGVAHYLATTVTAPIDRTLRALEGIANAIEAAA
jgi:N-acetylglucosamine-6-phosphate deacetylase